MLNGKHVLITGGTGSFEMTENLTLLRKSKPGLVV